MKRKDSPTLTQPDRPEALPETAQWLAGEGAGSWFFLTKSEDYSTDEYLYRRYAPEGGLECERMVKLVNDKEFNINMPYRFTYISHCKKCTIEQQGEHFVFKATNKISE